MSRVSDRLSLRLASWYQFIHYSCVDVDLVALAQRSGLLNAADSAGLARFESFVDGLQNQDWSVLPPIVTRPQDQLGGAKAVYVHDSPTIVLNRDWLLSQNTSDLDFIEVLTEQVAYFLDASLQRTDGLDDGSKVSAAQAFANQLLAARSDLVQPKPRSSADPAGVVSVDGIGADLKALISSSPAWVGEYQSIKVDHQWQTIELQQAYREPVVLVSDPSLRGRQAATVRLKDVSPSSFQIRLDEIEIRKQRHRRELVSFLVVEAGDWQLPDGTRLSAGTFKSAQKNTNNFTATTKIKQYYSNKEYANKKSRRNDNICLQRNPIINKQLLQSASTFVLRIGNTTRTNHTKIIPITIFNNEFVTNIPFD